MALLAVWAAGGKLSSTALPAAWAAGSRLR
jgi:hypothetical protein